MYKKIGSSRPLMSIWGDDRAVSQDLCVDVRRLIETGRVTSGDFSKFRDTGAIFSDSDEGMFMIFSRMCKPNIGILEAYSAILMAVMENMMDNDEIRGSIYGVGLEGSVKNTLRLLEQYKQWRHSLNSKQFA